MDIPVAVFGQKLVMQSNQHRLAPGSQKFIRFVFDLSDDWDDLTAFAQFTQGSNSYNDYLDNDNSVYLPSEITTGECLVMLYGTGDNAVIGTTNALKLYINEDNFVADAQSTVITESLYQQLIARLNDFVEVERIASVQEVRQALGIDD